MELFFRNTDLIHELYNNTDNYKKNAIYINTKRALHVSILVMYLKTFSEYFEMILKLKYLIYLYNENISMYCINIEFDKTNIVYCNNSNNKKIMYRMYRKNYKICKGAVYLDTSCYNGKAYIVLSKDNNFKIIFDNIGNIITIKINNESAKIPLTILYKLKNIINNIPKSFHGQDFSKFINYKSS